jgi:hypothetical protein
MRGIADPVLGVYFTNKFNNNTSFLHQHIVSFER